MDDRNDAAVDDPLSHVARSLLASAQRIAEIERDPGGAPGDDSGGRARGFLHDAGTTARTILLEARETAVEERERLTAKVDESHERVRALLADLDFGRPSSRATHTTIALPTAPLPRIAPPPVVLPPVPAIDRQPTFDLAPAPPLPQPLRQPLPPQPWSPAPWLRSLFRVPGDPQGLSPQRRRWAETFLWVRNAGIITLLFVVYQLWGTGVGQARSQRTLMKEWNTALASSEEPAAAPAADSGESSSARLPPPPPGRAVAVLQIPKIGLEQAVVEGTATNDLRKGPGHYQKTPLPGEHGNVAIAGHRTTYGAPFNRLDDLQRGDTILLNTKRGVVRYVVSTKRVVGPDKRGAIQPTQDDRLTLTTCHPKYSASQRLIVIAALAPAGTPTPGAGPSTSVAAAITADRLASPARRARPVQDVRVGADFGALFPTIGWGLLLLLVSLRARHMAWQRLRRHAYLLASPVVLALLVLFFERLDRALPPNY